MGACDVYFTIGKQVTSRAELEGYLKKKQEQDREYNGHQEGYSGDFQTVDGIKTDFSKLFTSFNEALQYCLDNTEKWGDALAVHYHDVSVPTSKQELKLQERIKKVRTELDQMRLVKKTSGFSKCSGCGSRLANTKLKRKFCPLCNGSLLTEREEKTFAKKTIRVQELEQKLVSIRKLNREKAIAKLGAKNVKTLIAGWAAC
jgi:hypothetical protein